MCIQIRIFRSIKQGLFERDLNVLASGLDLNLTSEGVMLIGVLKFKVTPLNLFTVGRSKLGLQLIL